MAQAMMMGQGMPERSTHTGYSGQTDGQGPSCRTQGEGTTRGLEPIAKHMAIHGPRRGLP